MNSLPLFPTSIIGSMPRPAHVLELIAGEADRTDAGYHPDRHRDQRQVDHRDPAVVIRLDRL